MLHEQTVPWCKCPDCNLRKPSKILFSPFDVNWMSPVQGKSSPVQVKEPYGNLDMVTYRLSSCNPECTKEIKVHLSIILERGSGRAHLWFTGRSL